jgi:hypothetical protein
VSGKTEAAIRARLASGEGMVKVAKTLGVGVSTVVRVRREMKQNPSDGEQASANEGRMKARVVSNIFSEDSG